MNAWSEDVTDTSIRIEYDVRDRLKARGRKGETYSEIITSLLNATADESPSAESGGD